MDHLFKLNGCDDIFVLSVAELRQGGRVKELKSDGHNHACHVQFNLLRMGLDGYSVKRKLVADGAASLVRFGKTLDRCSKVTRFSFYLHDLPMAKQRDLGVSDDLEGLLAHLAQHAPVALLDPFATVVRCRTHQIALSLYEIHMVP